jgi:hypothetical protein
MTTFRNTLLHLHRPVEYWVECSVTLAFKLQTPMNHPEESVRHSEHGEKLKSRITLIYLESLITDKIADIIVVLKHT